MGKLLVKIGLKIQALWGNLLCKWNSFLLMMTVNVNKCPNKKCACNR